MKWGVRIEQSAPHQDTIVVSRESISVISAAFALNTIFTWKENWQKNYSYLGSCMWQTFSQKWSKWTVISRKTTDGICCNDSILNKNQNFGNPARHQEVDCLLVLNDFSDKIGGEMNKYDFFGYCVMSEICQCLEDLHNSVNQSFQMTDGWCYKVMHG